MASKRNESDSSTNKRRPKNLMERNAFFAMLSARGKPTCSFHINLDGQIGVSSMVYGITGPVTAITPKPTFDLMADELQKFFSKHSIEGCIIGLVTDKDVAEFVERFAHRLFETEKLKDVKYTLFHTGVSYDSLMITSSKDYSSLMDEAFDPNKDHSSGRKRLGQFKNWRVPPFFHDEICALSKPTFTLRVSLNGGIHVSGCGLDKVIGIFPKSTFQLMSQELVKLISEHSVEGCIVGILGGGGGGGNGEIDFLESFAHRLFQTGELKEVRYTFHLM